MRLMRNEADNPPAFLYRAVTNICLNILRDKKRRRELLKEHGTEVEPGPSPAPDDAMILRKVLGLVPKDVALIAAYFFVDGLEHAEIAALLSMERRTVGRRLEKFRALAKDIVEEASS